MRKILISLAAAALFATPAFAADIVEALAAHGSLNRFVESIKAAAPALTETLKGAGPVTVFAPNDNNAFMKIEEGGEFEALLLDKPKLNGMLNLHIVRGKVSAADLKEGMKLTTLQGVELTITLVGGPKVNGAKILAADIAATNGVIHVVDSILKPAAK